MANPTADWERVGDKFYRKTQLYTAVFDQDLELENYVVTGCSYGGAIGMCLCFPSCAFRTQDSSTWTFIQQVLLSDVKGAGGFGTRISGELWHT